MPKKEPKVKDLPKALENVENVKVIKPKKE